MKKIEDTNEFFHQFFVSGNITIIKIDAREVKLGLFKNQHLKNVYPSLHEKKTLWLLYWLLKLNTWIKCLLNYVLSSLLKCKEWAWNDDKKA